MLNRSMEDADRQHRAQARKARMTLHKSHLAAAETDPEPVYGAQALSLAARLTRESWSLTGIAEPSYTRSQIPCRFVPGRLT